MKFINIDKVIPLLESDEKGRTKKSLSNYTLILQEDDRFANRIKYDELSGQMELDVDTKEWLWKRHGSNRITDTDMNNIQLIIERNYGISSDKLLNKAIDIVAHTNAYHPIKQCLLQLHEEYKCYCKKYDQLKKKYVELLLQKYLGVENIEYSAKAMEIAMLGAVKRIFEPGCKFDLMVCLVGSQGLGKSTFLRLLSLKDEWFSDDVSRLDDENIYRKLQGHWILEMSEMRAAVSTKSLESIKAFISKQKDTYKVPYERHPQDRLRQCVFFGSTNDMNFIPKDRTGQRRFIPIISRDNLVEQHIWEEMGKARSEIKLAWGEVMCIFFSKDYKLVLPDKYDDILQNLQSMCMIDDGYVGIIQEWLDHYKGEYICTRMIYEDALGKTDDPSLSKLRDISSILNNQIEGWIQEEKQKRLEKYGRQRVWKRINLSTMSTEN